MRKFDEGAELMLCPLHIDERRQMDYYYTREMKMRLLKVGLATIIMYFLLVPGFAYAQLPRGNWWENEKIREALRITDEQVEKIKEIVDEGKERVEKLREEYKVKSKALKRKIDIEKLRKMSEEEITRIIDELQGIRGKLEKTRFLTMVRTLRVLTEEQAVKLVEKQEEIRKKAREKFREKLAPGNNPKHGDKGKD
jgi:Spy/CpxP family protein refolding chaperone